MSRLTLLHINLIGAFVALLVGAALYFTIITGAQDARQQQETQYTDVSTRAAKLDGARRNRDQALATEAQTKKDYDVFNRKYMPTMNYARDRIRTMMTVWWPNNGRSWPERFIRGVRGHMASERKRFGVVWTNPQVLQLPAYGPDPNTIDMGDGDETLTFGPYPMVVRVAKMQDALNHTRSWSSISGLGVPNVEGMTLTGNSPNLFCSYNVSFTIILKEKIPVNDPKIQAGQSAGMGGMGGMGGRMGGPPGGMGGGPMGSGGMAAMMGSGGGGGASMGGGPSAAGVSSAGGAPAGGGGASSSQAVRE